MKRDDRLLFGLAAAIVFGVGIVGLAMTVPGYSQVRQTVSEIGEIGSPARIPFAVLLCGVAALLLVFAWGVWDSSRREGRAVWGAALVAFMAVPAAGIGVFAYPHPLHNVFGLSELIGYQAPLAFALGWRREPSARPLVSTSWIMFGIVWIAILLNLSQLFGSGPVWDFIKPGYGLVQRALFGAWFVWCAIASLLLWRRSGHSRRPALAA